MNKNYTKNMDKKTNAGMSSPAVVNEDNGINSNMIGKTITASKMKLSKMNNPLAIKHYIKPYFTPQQVSELTSKAYNINPRLACLWHLGYLTGMRLNELLQLEWSQVDLEKGFLGITVRKSNCDERTKFPYQRKRYPLHGEVLEILEQMKREDKSNCKYLFHTWRGKKRFVVTVMNRRLIESIGLSETIKNGSHTYRLYTFHSLRASYFMRKRMADTTTESNLISNTAAKFSAANNSNSEL